jgi:hypothetical protein
MLLAFVCFRAASDETELPTPNHPAVHDPNKVFNTEQMNQAVFAFRRYEDASLRYTGIESHEGLTHYGLYDTVVARE